MGTAGAFRIRGLAVALALTLGVLGTVGAAGASASTRIVIREGKRRLVAIPPAGGPARTLVRLHRGALLGTAASRDGRLFAYISRVIHRADGELVYTDRIWTLAAGGRPQLLKTVVSAGRERNHRPFDSVAISPDERTLLLQRNDGRVFTLAVDGSGFRAVVPDRYDFKVGSGRNSSNVEFTPSGRRIIGLFYPDHAVESEVGGIGTVPLRGGPVHFLRRGSFANGVGHFFAPTVSPDGRLVAFVIAGRSGDSITVMDRDGSHSHRLRRSILPGWGIGQPVFSPSGKSLAFVGKFFGQGNVVIHRTPQALFTIRLGGTHLRKRQTEKAQIFDRDPAWVR